MNTAQKIVKAFELGTLDEIGSAPVTFNVSVIDDVDGNPVTGFTIVGKNSDEYQQASLDVQRQNIKRASKRSKQLDGSTDEGADSIARTVKENSMHIAMSVVKDWFGFNLEGAPMAFDRAYAEKLLTKYPTWVDAINNALSNDQNFIKV